MSPRTARQTRSPLTVAPPPPAPKPARAGSPTRQTSPTRLPTRQPKRPGGSAGGGRGRAAHGWPVHLPFLKAQSWLGALCGGLALALIAALLFPDAPSAQPARAALGMAGLPVAIAWLGWLGWWLRAPGRLSAGQVAAWCTLTVSWFIALALREEGGQVGRGLLDALDAGFGRVAGLLLLTLAALVALILLLRPHRLLTWLALIGRGGRALLGISAGNATTLDPPPPRPARDPSPTAPTEPAPIAPPSDAEMVILGPGSATADAEGAPPPAPPPPTTRPIAPDGTAWSRPDPGLLSTGGDSAAFSPADLRARARIIEETLFSFGVQARVAEVQQGPAITQFGLDPAPGVAVNRIVSRQNDLALRLGAPSLRVLAPVPGRPLVGIEVPNTSVAMVQLGDLLAAPTFAKARLPIGIGMDVAGKPVVGDLARMPHLLIAGATGSGKSVSINALIASLLMARTPDEAQLILVDPKQVEMSQYKGLPHLRLPVVTDMDKVVATLRWTVMEMERRYNRFSDVGARNIVVFNERFPDERLGYLVVVIDELADMMMTAADDVERLICRLAQLGRAAGVHLVVATQRPSVDVLTGLIKANLPTRLAFAVSSQTDSRVILDRVGAERLLGRGDGLYQAGDEMNPRRVQGAYVADEEIEALCAHWREQALPRHTEEDEAQLEKLARQDDPEEKLLMQARQIMAEKGGEVTVSYLQRRLKIGLQKADRIHKTLIADEAAARSVPPGDD